MINKGEKATLVDVLDKVLEKGAVVSGDVVLRIADVDLVYLGLRLILTSVGKAEELSGRSKGSPDSAFTKSDVAYIEKLQKEKKRRKRISPG
jgi:hypothetical protein